MVSSHIKKHHKIAEFVRNYAKRGNNGPEQALTDFPELGLSDMNSHEQLVVVHDVVVMLQSYGWNDADFFGMIRKLLKHWFNGLHDEQGAIWNEMSLIPEMRSPQIESQQCNPTWLIFQTINEQEMFFRTFVQEISKSREHRLRAFSDLAEKVHPDHQGEFFHRVMRTLSEKGVRVVSETFASSVSLLNHWKLIYNSLQQPPQDNCLQFQGAMTEMMEQKPSIEYQIQFIGEIITVWRDPDFRFQKMYRLLFDWWRGQNALDQLDIFKKVDARWDQSKTRGKKTLEQGGNEWWILKNEILSMWVEQDNFVQFIPDHSDYQTMKILIKDMEMSPDYMETILDRQSFLWTSTQLKGIRKLKVTFQTKVHKRIEGFKDLLRNVVPTEAWKDQHIEYDL